MDRNVLLAALGYFFAINTVGLLLMYLDKRRARLRRRRVRERILLSVAAVGGAFGVYIGMRWRRHKRAKPAFRLGLPLLSIAYGIVMLWMVYRYLLTLA